jgi:HSP20 family molecular chaperone IbpA
MSTLTLWTRRDPFAEFDTIVRRAFGSAAAPAGFTPNAEITRDGDDAIVRLELPGVDVEKDITVEIKDNALVVRGERRDERTEERDGRSLREVRYGAFRRSFDLPTHVTADAVAASYDAGMLTVRVTGAYAGTAARQIPVTTTAATAVEAAPESADA